MEDTRLKNYEERLKIYDEFSNNSFKDARENISEYREIMRNFALASGALSGVSFASLSASLLKIENFIILGSCLLLISTFICFTHLFFDNRKEIKSILQFRHSLKPLENIISAFEKLTSSRISEEEYSKFEAEYEKHKKDVLKNERNIDKTFDSNNIEIWLMISVGIGLVLVLLGFIIPIFNPILADFLR